MFAVGMLFSDGSCLREGKVREPVSGDLPRTSGYLFFLHDVTRGAVLLARGLCVLEGLESDSSRYSPLIIFPFLYRCREGRFVSV